MSNYADKLAVGEQAISDFINGHSSVSDLEKKLSAVFSSCKFFNKENEFTVSIVRTDKSKEPFFGARVYPAMDLLDKIVSSVVTEFHPFRDLWTAWQKIDHWVIELDSALFDRANMSLVPKEITACILHEVGHTVYSDKVLERFYRAYKSMYVHMKGSEKDTIKLGYALFTIPMTVSCGLRSWTRGRNGIKEEFFADTIVRDAGYGEFYISLLTKIIEAYGNSIVDGTDAESDNRVSERVRWATTNITDAIRRKNRLSDDMYLAAANTPSTYMKALYSKVLNELGVNMRERYTGDAVECTVERFSDPNCLKAYEMNCDTDRYRTLDMCIESCMTRDKYTPGTPAFESILKSKLKKGLPSWIDIDRIEIEIDRISNHHDRTFVLDMIYDKIEEINEFMDYASNDPAYARKYRDEAERMLATLDNQRNAVLNKKSFSNQYRVFVKSPEGYEG